MRSDEIIKEVKKPELKSNSVAHKMAEKQKEISVTEFFERNKHILGFDSKTKTLLMGIKEAVDNSLDACEEADILPEIIVKIEEIKDFKTYAQYKVIVEDNGPGIVHKNIPNVFGRLLYGSRFHALRQSRGQQGIGISATIMYGYQSTGKKAHIRSKIDGEMAREMDLSIDVKVNRPIVTCDTACKWEGKEHGTYVEYYTEGKYQTGKQSIYEYLKNTAIVNPHSKITFTDPNGKTFVFERATDIMPSKTLEIKPHPEGVSIGDLQRYADATQQKTVSAFLKEDFSKVTGRIAKEILTKAKIPENKKPSDLTRDDIEEMVAAISTVKIMAPSTECLSPIGDNLIKKGLMHVLEGLRPDYYAQPVTRNPKTVNGNPFVVEVGIVYGGDIPSDGQVSILRFANRVPLLYQPGACAITKAVSNVDWRRYGLEQRGGKGIPYGPAIILVHVASTKVPFTSEGKEAVADFEIITDEIEAALKLCARNLRTHLNKNDRRQKTRAKFEIVQEILPLIAQKSAEYLNKPVPNLDLSISNIMNVIWVEPTVTKNKKTRIITFTVYNYTRESRSMMLHTKLPLECINMTLYSSNFYKEKNDEGKVSWELLNIPPSKKVEITFELEGDFADTYNQNEVYISGINPVIVMGADALPGDWGIKGMEVVEYESDNLVDSDDDESEEAEILDDE